jgi:hypothetical protein
MPSGRGTDNERIAKRVIAIVAHHRAMKSSDIKRTMDLYSDLGITGDDVDDLLADLKKHLAIDFSKLRFDRHFGHEAPYGYAGPIWQTIAWWVLGTLIVPTATFALLIWPGVEPPLLIVLVALSVFVVAWGVLGPKVLPGERKWRRQRVPITIDDLVEAAKRGSWSDDKYAQRL